MDITTQAKIQLAPQLEHLLALFPDGTDPAARAFFGEQLQRLHALQDDLDLAGFFFDLSTAAFHGFHLDADQAAAIDRLLGLAEDIARTLTAGSTPETSRPH